MSMTNISICRDVLNPLIKGLPWRRIPWQVQQVIFAWSDLYAELKEKEYRKKGHPAPNDNKNLPKRSRTGHVTEWGNLDLFGMSNYFDYSLGDSVDYTKPDLSTCFIPKEHQISGEVKGAQVFFDDNRKIVTGLVHLVPKEPKCPIIFGLTDNHFDRVCMIGVASPEVICKYATDDLIGNAENPVKTGFYGYDHLHPIPKTWEELGELCDQLGMHKKRFTSMATAWPH